MSECVVRMDIDEMPTACGPCKLSCTAICKEWTKVDRKEIGRTKSPNCPILAILPEGHGRLVDADANFLGVIHLSGGGFANYNTTIAERLGEEDMRMVKVIVPAERSET